MDRLREAAGHRRGDDDDHDEIVAGHPAGYPSGHPSGHPAGHPGHSSATAAAAVIAALGPDEDAGEAAFAALGALAPYTPQEASLEEQAVLILTKYRESIEPDRSYSEHSSTLLHAALQGRSKRLVELLLAANAQADLQNAHGQSALHIAYQGLRGSYCKDQRSWALVEVLLRSRRANPSMQDDDGCSTLHYAAATGDASVVALLLMYKADSHCVDVRGKTPLEWATAHGFPECASLIQGNRADAEERAKLDLKARGIDTVSVQMSQADKAHKGHIKHLESQKERLQKRLTMRREERGGEGKKNGEDGGGGSAEDGGGGNCNGNADGVEKEGSKEKKQSSDEKDQDNATTATLADAGAGTATATPAAPDDGPSASPASTNCIDKEVRTLTSTGRGTAESDSASGALFIRSGR